MPTDLLALVGQTQDLAVSQQVSEEDAAAIVKSGDWLPRVQVMGSTSTLVQEGKLPVGIFALVHSKGNFVDLGKQINFLGIAFRAKAMRFTAKPISIFDRNDEEFKQIQIDSQKQNSGCGWGPEFLLWLPAQATFATLFCSSPTLRNAAPDILAIMRKDPTTYGPGAVTGEPHFIKTETRSWWGARFYQCTTPLPPVVDDEAEWKAKYKEELEKFKNPPKKVIETEAAPEAARAR